MTSIEVLTETKFCQVPQTTNLVEINTPRTGLCSDFVSQIKFHKHHTKHFEVSWTYLLFKHFDIFSKLETY